MLEQTVLSFKLESTEEQLTAQAGLALFGEFWEGRKLSELINRELPAPGSAVGFKPDVYARSIIMMLNAGGRSLEDLRILANDKSLTSLLSMRVPSPDATGNWLRRMGCGTGLVDLDRVCQQELEWALKHDERDEYTLDMDASQIIAEKQDAERTYKGEKGYMPMIGHLAENGLVLHDEFRAGNVAPASQNLEFFQACLSKMPEGKRIGYFRADSATYQAGVINECERRGIRFAIGAKQDRAVKASIAAIPESEWQPYRDGMIASTVHCMENTEAFTLIVFRKGRQLSLFDENDGQWGYHAIATNRTEDAATVMDWYAMRGEYSENRIKELKIGFGMERMPCGQIKANAVFFRLGVMAYNLFVMFKRQLLPASWRKHQIQTVRWRLYQIPARITRHARSLWMKIEESHLKLFRDIRMRCFQCI